MRASLFLAAVLLTSCTANEAELKVINAGIEAQIARLMEAAQQIAESQRTLGQLEKQFVAMGGSLPPVTIRERRPEPPVRLPPVSPFEDSDAATLRARIADGQRRLTELKSVVGDLDYLNERRALLDAKIEELMRATKP